MVARTFTIEQAQELVPLLNELFSEARALVDELLALRQDGLTAVAKPSAELDEDTAFRIKQLTALLQSRLQLVTAVGLQVRRVDGLVDIPAWIDGEIGYFCWRYGESKVSHWHRADEGCTDRRALERRLPLEA